MADPVTVLVSTEQERVPRFLEDLARNPRYKPLGWTTSVEQTVLATRERRPDVLVAEVTTTDRLRDLADAVPTLGDTRVVVVSALPPEVCLLTAVAAGARGFVRKPVEPGRLDQAVAAAAAGQAYVDPRSTTWLVDFVLYGHKARPLDGLTFRQLQVVQLVRGGLTNREIARALGVSSETVKSHLQEAMRRLQVHDRWDAGAVLEAEVGDA